jgi:SulP family sulfate permease
MLSVLSVGVLFGVVVGIALSLLWLIHVAAKPSMPVLGRKPGTQVYRDLDEHAGDETDPGVVVVRIEGGVFFATAAALDERVRAILAGELGLHTMVLDMAAVTFVDSQGAAKIGELRAVADAEGVDLRLARLQPEVSEVLAADGVIDMIGDDRIHGRVQGAVAAAQAAHTDAIGTIPPPPA